MPLLDIAIAEPPFQNYLDSLRVHHFVIGTTQNQFLSENDKRWGPLRKYLRSPRNLNFNLGHSNRKSHNNRLLVKAVATLEPKFSIVNKYDEKKSEELLVTYEPNEDSEEIDEKEKLRRIRISKANKGNTPWNKGRKHSPETLQRIRERTRLAMQNPKVKMKLSNMGHAQSPETRKKIGVGVRIGWQKRREKLLLQETCLFDWQNLIAESSRQGLQGEEELQWDSYDIINEKLKEEWLASIEYRKTMPRPNKGSKRAPKSLEQRRKIAEAIAAKWADPEYRSRVCTSLAKYHGTTEGAERKVRRKPSNGSQTTPRTPKKRVTTPVKSTPTEIKVKKRTTPKYKDPLANSKLEMLKSIRAQRVVSEASKNEALERAKLLIEEAEKAANALEIAAMRSPFARASLIEARKLIIEATQSIESIENKEVTTQDELALGTQNLVENDEGPIKDNASDGYHGGVIGTHNRIPQKSNIQNPDTSIYKMPIPLPSQLSMYEFAMLDLGSYNGKPKSRELIDREYMNKLNGATKLNGSNCSVTKFQIPLKNATKKWVRGRLVEVTECE